MHRLLWIALLATALYPLALSDYYKYRIAPIASKSSKIHDDFSRLVAGASTTAEALQFVQKNSPEDSLFLVFRQSTFAYFSHRKYYDFSDPRVLPAYESTNVYELSRSLSALGITHIFLPTYPVYGIYNSTFEALLTHPNCSEVVFQNRSYKIFSLYESCTGQNAPYTVTTTVQLDPHYLSGSIDTEYIDGLGTRITTDRFPINTLTTGIPPPTTGKTGGMYPSIDVHGLHRLCMHTTLSGTGSITFLAMAFDANSQYIATLPLHAIVAKNETRKHHAMQFVLPAGTDHIRLHLSVNERADLIIHDLDLGTPDYPASSIPFSVPSWGAAASDTLTNAIPFWQLHNSGASRNWHWTASESVTNSVAELQQIESENLWLYSGLGAITTSPASANDLRFRIPIGAKSVTVTSSMAGMGQTSMYLWWFDKENEYSNTYVLQFEIPKDLTPFAVTVPVPEIAKNYRLGFLIRPFDEDLGFGPSHFQLHNTRIYFDAPYAVTFPPSQNQIPLKGMHSISLWQEYVQPTSLPGRILRKLGLFNSRRTPLQSDNFPQVEGQSSEIHTMFSGAGSIFEAPRTDEALQIPSGANALEILGVASGRHHTDVRIYWFGKNARTGIFDLGKLPLSKKPRVFRFPLNPPPGAEALRISFSVYGDNGSPLPGFLRIHDIKIASSSSQGSLD